MRGGFTFDQRLGSDTPLIVSGGCQARIANYIAYGINMRQGGLIHAVDLQLAAAVGLQTDIFQRQGVGVAGAAGIGQRNRAEGAGAAVGRAEAGRVVRPGEVVTDGVLDVAVERFSLDDGVAAYRKLAANDLRGRAVVVP